MIRRLSGQPPLVVAGALLRATTRAVLGAGSRSEPGEEGATRASERLARRAGVVVRAANDLGRRVVEGEVGIGPVRVDPDDVTWARHQLAAGLRSLLIVPTDTAERLRTADPTTMARTVLALVGGEEALAPLPTPEDQIRSRFRDLLDPDRDADDGSLGPALLTITTQLSPDEARLLRHLVTSERAIVVAIEATTLTSRRGPTVAEHLSVLVERSGGEDTANGPAHIANLLRLGLVTIDWERSDDHPDVTLIEDTPAYRDAVRAVQADGRRPSQRVGTLLLTPLGRRLVSIALEALAPPTADVLQPPPAPLDRPS